MPIGILKFKLPEEENEFNDARNGTKFCVVLQELTSYLRKLSKYENKKSINIEALQDKIHELLDGIDIWN